MNKLFNRAFFKFSLGFLCIIAMSFGIVFLVNFNAEKSAQEASIQSQSK